MSKIVFPSLILYKVESVRNKDLNLDVRQPCDLFLLYLVRQCAKKLGRSQANHLPNFNSNRLQQLIINNCVVVSLFK